MFISGVEITLILLLMYVYPFDCYLKLKRYERLTERVNGRICTINERNKNHRKSYDSHEIYYHVHGKEYINKPIFDSENIKNIKVGDIVPILIDTKDPNKIIEEFKFEEGKEKARENFRFSLKFVLPAAILFTVVPIIFSIISVIKYIR